MRCDFLSFVLVCSLVSLNFSQNSMTFFMQPFEENSNNFAVHKMLQKPRNFQYTLFHFVGVKVCVFVLTIRRIDKAKIYKKMLHTFRITLNLKSVQLKNILLYRTKVELLYIYIEPRFSRVSSYSSITLSIHVKLI